MKNPKSLAFASVITLALAALAACSSTKKNEEPAPIPAAVVTTAPVHTVAMNDSMNLGASSAGRAR